MLKLNKRAADLCSTIAADVRQLRVNEVWLDIGTELLDFGVHAPGGLEAGRRLAEVSMAGLGRVDFVPCDPSLWLGTEE